MATYKIYTKRLAYQLVECGHTILDKEPNHKKQGFLVWIFKDTSQLHKDIERLNKR